MQRNQFNSEFLSYVKKSGGFFESLKLHRAGQIERSACLLPFGCGTAAAFPSLFPLCNAGSGIQSPCIGQMTRVASLAVTIHGGLLTPDTHHLKQQEINMAQTSNTGCTRGQRCRINPHKQGKGRKSFLPFAA